MTDKTSSRRDLFALAAIGAAMSAAPFLPTQALAYQGNMEAALSALQAALQSLQQATPDKGGHREHAIVLIRQAIWQTEAGIRYAAEHFGD